MKHRLPTWLLLLAAGPLLAADPTPGATRETVEKELGRPVASRKPEDGVVIAKYPRGTVTYRDGRAEQLAIIPEAEWNARLEREAKVREEAAARRTADNAALDALLESKAYAQLSASGKLSRLDAFSRKHPAADTADLRVDLAGLIATRADASTRLATLEKKLDDTRDELARRDSEIADLRRRVDEARATPPPASVAQPAQQVVYQPTPVLVNPAAVIIHDGGRRRHRDDNKATPTQPAVPASPSQVFKPYNPISEYAIGAKSPTGFIPYKPNAPAPAPVTTTKDAKENAPWDAKNTTSRPAR